MDFSAELTFWEKIMNHQAFPESKRSVDVKYFQQMTHDLYGVVLKQKKITY